MRKCDPGPDFAEVGEDHRPPCSHCKAALLCGLRGGSGKHRLGEDHWKTSHGTARCRAYGEEKNVGFCRQSPARVGLRTGTCGCGPCPRCLVVPGERLCCCSWPLIPWSSPACASTAGRSRR